MLKKKRNKKEEKEKMNKKEISIIKKKALEDKVPIIMDDTLEVIAKILDEIKPKKILEIGTAVGYSAICFSEYLQENGKIDTIERDTERDHYLTAQEALEYGLIDGIMDKRK